MAKAIFLQIGLGLFTAGWRRQNPLTAPPHVSEWPIPLGCFCNLPLVSRHCRSSFFVCWIEVLGLSGLYLVALVAGVGLLSILLLILMPTRYSGSATTPWLCYRGLTWKPTIRPYLPSRISSIPCTIRSPFPPISPEPRWTRSFSLSSHPSAPPTPSIMTQIERITERLEKPELDDRSYRVIRLPNQLEALLVHDPDTDKASAAVNVNVGNFSDEDDMPGMAHAVEHLLFMGTKKVWFPSHPPRCICRGTADVGLWLAFSTPRRMLTTSTLPPTLVPPMHTLLPPKQTTSLRSRPLGILVNPRPLDKIPPPSPQMGPMAQ